MKKWQQSSHNKKFPSLQEILNRDIAHANREPAQAISYICTMAK